MIKKKAQVIAGKRKTAVAKIKFVEGSGKIFYNFIPHTDLEMFHKLSLLEPIKIYESELGPDLQYDFHITTKGGGKEGQIQAARLALARTLLYITGSEVLKKAFIKYDRNILVQDSRRKETRKPGDSKARAKRQKSFR